MFLLTCNLYFSDEFAEVSIDGLYMIVCILTTFNRWLWAGDRNISVPGVRMNYVPPLRSIKRVMSNLTTSDSFGDMSVLSTHSHTKGFIGGGGGGGIGGSGITGQGITGRTATLALDELSHSGSSVTSMSSTGVNPITVTGKFRELTADGFSGNSRYQFYVLNTLSIRVFMYMYEHYVCTCVCTQRKSNFGRFMYVCSIIRKSPSIFVIMYRYLFFRRRYYRGNRE